MKFLVKILHPGNTLFVAIALTAIGIGLIGFGIACPPALVFVALGFAAVSAITAIGYGVNALRKDFAEYQANLNNNVADLRARNGFADFIQYIKYSAQRLKNWMKIHPVQTGFMIVGALVFTAALVVTTGGLAGIPLFGFMTAGAAGGSIGLVSSFFSAGLGSFGSASVVALLSSIFAGAALIVGPTNIIDTIRRFASGIWKRMPEREAQGPLLTDYPTAEECFEDSAEDYLSQNDNSNNTFCAKVSAAFTRFWGSVQNTRLAEPASEVYKNIRVTYSVSDSDSE